MSGVPSAFILVLVEVLVMPEGVVMVLDLLMVAELFDMVEDLLMPAGLVEVVVRVVVVLGTWVVRVVVIFDELALVVAGVVWAWAARPLVTNKAASNPNKRFMVCGKKSGGESLCHTRQKMCRNVGIYPQLRLAGWPRPLGPIHAKSPALLLARGF